MIKQNSRVPDAQKLQLIQLRWEKQRESIKSHDGRWTFHENALVRNVSLVQVHNHLYGCPAERTPTTHGRASKSKHRKPKLSAQERWCITMRYTTSLQTMPLLLQDGPSKSSPAFSGPPFSAPPILWLQIAKIDRSAKHISLFAL